MAPKTTKRRSPHEGGAYSYMTRAGERWAWKTTLTLADGTRKQVMKRGFETKKAALASLRDALAESGKTGYSEPSRQPTGEYLAPGSTACGSRRPPWPRTGRTCGST